MGQGRVSRGLNSVTLPMTAGMAPTKWTATITHVVTSMIQASAAGCRRKMTRWTGHDIKAVLRPSIQV